MNTKKKGTLKLIVGALILGATGYWTMMSRKDFDLFAIVLATILVVLALSSISRGIKDLKDAKRGLTVQDELTRKIHDKASAIAFRTSIYMWLFGLFFIGQLPIDTITEFKLFIAMGLLAMGLIFLITRLYLSKIGIADENED